MVRAFTRTFYNFAHIPYVHSRDAFWHMKYPTGEKTDSVAETLDKAGLPNQNELLATSTKVSHTYEDIEMPKNTPIGIFIGALAFVFGFSIIWHMYWLTPIAFLGILVCMIVRSFDEETEYIVPALWIEKIERRRAHL